jgi:hypothetical protein
MTLNSTGLGVGGVPDHKLQAVGGYVASGKLSSASSGNIGGLLMYCSTDNAGRRSWGLKAESGLTGVLGFWVSSANNTEPFSGSQVMSLDSSGNVGVGVTPSAWGNYKVLEVGTTSSLYNDGGVATDLSNNMYINSSFAYIRKIAAAATRYEQNAGAHAWYNAANSTAGSTITFTQAMTLDASGNLLVGTTSANGSASNSVKNVGGVFSTVNGATGSTATGVAATVFTAPSEAVFIVSAYIVGSASPANYNAVAIVRVSGGTAAITTISTASNLTISLSGLNVQATQTSGINQAFAYSAIRIS